MSIQFNILMDRHKEKVINMILLGDFNLDYDKKHDVSYASNNMFEIFYEEQLSESLIQIVKFKPWSRIFSNSLKESTFDLIELIPYTSKKCY